MRSITVIGISGSTSFDTIIDYFVQLGGDVLLLDPRMVCGMGHIRSSVIHAERAFRNGTNRSKSILTETMLYAAGERQISKAMERMRPKAGCKEMVAVLFDIEEFDLDGIGMVRCDGIIEASWDKAKELGMVRFEGISLEKTVLEHVAMVDIMKF